MQQPEYLVTSLVTVVPPLNSDVPFPPLELLHSFSPPPRSGGLWLLVGNQVIVLAAANGFDCGIIRTSFTWRWSPDAPTFRQRLVGWVFRSRLLDHFSRLP